MIRIKGGDTHINDCASTHVRNETTNSVTNIGPFNACLRWWVGAAHRDDPNSIVRPGFTTVLFQEIGDSDAKAVEGIGEIFQVDPLRVLPDLPVK